ncbi:NAD-dependent epimerase/dehydratase family protein [Candidatus Protofrankia californiensis]|uniref:NAD-dependent epimerase/dehydratase family protein n=1 Tax=Candidatus Protofrankia californiensis TaxID=1839754 RepID=UPI001041ABCE|nr:NAD(P)-dependent oxidoreductase [Candidatus Protofrankia californiensis]
MTSRSDHGSATRVLITGAAGNIGHRLRSRLARPGRTLRLLDIAELPPAATGEEVELIQGSIADMDVMERACRDVDAVIHLAGNSREASWQEIMEVNIGGTYTVFEAARRSNVPRIVFASSAHAAGYAPVPRDAEVPDFQYPRPDSNYGVGKVAGEAIGSLYADRYGMDVICVRIGVCFSRPWRRTFPRWLSPDDCGRLFEACLTVPSPGFRLAWGVSGNTRGQLSLVEARRLGYEPRDDAEVFADEMFGEHGVVDADDPALRYVGGDWYGPDFDTARREYEGGRSDDI